MNGPGSESRVCPVAVEVEQKKNTRGKIQPLSLPNQATGRKKELGTFIVMLVCIFSGKKTDAVDVCYQRDVSRWIKFNLVILFCKPPIGGILPLLWRGVGGGFYQRASPLRLRHLPQKGRNFFELVGGDKFLLKQIMPTC